MNQKTKVIKNLMRALSPIETDEDILTPKEVKECFSYLENELLESEIRDFVITTKKLLPNNSHSDEECEVMLDFMYEKSWTIGFNGKTITVPNDATLFQGILDVLEIYIDENF